MRLNGIGPKIDSAGDGTGSGTANPAATGTTGGTGSTPPPIDPLEQWFQNWGSTPGIDVPGSGSTSPTTDPYAIDPGWLNGEAPATNGAVGGSDIGAMIDRLAELPPHYSSASTAFAHQAEAMPDYFVQKYTQFVDRMKQLESTELAAINNPATSAIERTNLQRLLEAVRGALARGMESLELAKSRKAQLELDWKTELERGDLNGDHWIGQPYTDTAYYMQEGPDGEITYYQNGQPVSMPIMVHDYESSLFSGIGGRSALDLINASDAEVSPGDDPVDMFLRINPEAYADSLVNSESAFRNLINFTVPPVLYVREGITTSSGETRMYSPITSWGTDANGNIIQQIPEDMDGITQVTVDFVRIYSQPSSVQGRNGERGSNHYIELYHGDQLIARIRIEGSQVAGDSAALEGLAVETGAGSSYLYASAVSFGVDGSLCSGNVKLDASNFKSNVQHVVEQGVFDSVMGIQEPQGSDDDSQRALESFRETLGSVRGTQTRDRYLDETDSRNSSISGLFLTNIRGDLELSAYNDIGKLLQANEYTDFAREHLPARFRDVALGDKLYTSTVKGGSGNNIMSVGSNSSARGSTYLIDVSFANVNCGSNDSTFISQREVSSIGNTATELPENWATYVNISAGDLYLNNGSGEETSQGLIDRIAEDIAREHDNPTEAQQQEMVDRARRRIEELSHNDYYACNGTIYATDKLDTDIVNNERCQDGGVGKDDMLTNSKTAMDDWWAEITRAPTADAPTLSPEAWQAIMGETANLSSEMDSFFKVWIEEINTYIDPSATEEMGGAGGAV